VKVGNAGIVTKLSGIYIKDDIIYYQLQIHNHSPLDYDIELLKFHIIDKKKGKRTALWGWNIIADPILP